MLNRHILFSGVFAVLGLLAGPLSFALTAACLGSPQGEEAVAVYRDFAPSIVYLTDDENSHGTGFLIREGGWILTNNHVVDDFPLDSERGIRTAKVLVGELAADGAMSLVPGGYLQADVYRTDERRDLALLKIRGQDLGRLKAPAIELASETGAPGSPCIAIGHPTQGVLWTLRRGELAGRGEFPKDQIGDFLIRGSDSGGSQASDEALASAPKRKVLLSSCGLNPGDSGGPLLNTRGQLIGVSFAVPTVDLTEGIDLAKFSYHIHLDEVRAFLESWPESPEIHPPSVYPPALAQIFSDCDEDGTPETWALMLPEQEQLTGYFVDLDQNSSSDAVEQLTSEELPEDTDPLKVWDWEFATNSSSTPSVSFELNNDGEPDIVMVPTGENQWLKYERDNEGRWTVSQWIGELRDTEFFQSEEMNRAFRRYLRKTK